MTDGFRKKGKVSVITDRFRKKGKTESPIFLLFRRGSRLIRSAKMDLKSLPKQSKKAC